MILNAANSSVGQVLLQLARLLRLRTVAVVRPPPQPHASGAAAAAAGVTATSKTHLKTPNNSSSNSSSGGVTGDSSGKWERTVSWLRGLGATEVLKDEGSLRVRASISWLG